jgi:hypothetical protein
MSEQQTAYKDGTCSECKGPMPKGTPIRFKKGARKDGTEVSIPVHAVCPKAGSPGSAEKKWDLPPGLAAGGAPPPVRETFVQIAAWLPASRVEIVVAAILKAREGVEGPGVH